MLNILIILNKFGVTKHTSLAVIILNLHLHSNRDNLKTYMQIIWHSFYKEDDVLFLWIRVDLNACLTASRIQQKWYGITLKWGQTKITSFPPEIVGHSSGWRQGLGHESDYRETTISERAPVDTLFDSPTDLPANSQCQQ